jgi:hypothetical protein
MPKALIVMSHQLLPKQKEELMSRFKVEKIIYLPEQLQRSWREIPSKGKMPEKSLDEIARWVKITCSREDVVLVQGEFGAVFYLVDYILQQGFKAIYATTDRDYTEEILPDNAVLRKHLFRHETFREYSYWRGI